MKRRVLIILGVVGVLLVLCVAVASLGGGPKPTPTPPQPTAASLPTAALPPTATAQPAATKPPVSTATAKPPTATATPLPKVGQTIVVGNWEYTVTGVEQVKVLTWSDFGNTSEAKGIWLIVYLTLKNVGKENFGINTWDFALTAGEVKYSFSTDGGAFMFIDYKKMAHLGEQFPPGVAVKTALIYDIAPDAKGLRLQLIQAKTSVDLGQ